MPPTVNYEKSAVNILDTFSQYGFRKTSMADIANAAGVSRHSIYKKFGSKEACYEWTIYTYLHYMYSRIFTTLENNSQTAPVVLSQVFDIFMGEAVEIVHNAHGTDLINDTFKAAHESGEDWPLRFETRLGEYLERQHCANREMAFVLISASKGLLIEAQSREEFSRDMLAVINGVLGNVR